MNIDPTLTIKCPTCQRKNFSFRESCMRCRHPFQPADKNADLLERLRGFAVSMPKHHVYGYVKIIRGPWYDDMKHQRAERINGHVFCPACDLAWPLVEEIEAWSLDENLGLWHGTEWGPGTAECLECGGVFVDTFDGCYQLK